MSERDNTTRCTKKVKRMDDVPDPVLVYVFGTLVVGMTSTPRRAVINCRIAVAVTVRNQIWGNQTPVGFNRVTRGKSGDASFSRRPSSVITSDFAAHSGRK